MYKRADLTALQEFARAAMQLSQEITQ